MFSGYENVETIKQFLRKFKSCYDLYMLTRPLCGHECAALKKNCREFGAWAKSNFSKIVTKRKFHVLVKHVPEKIGRNRSVGQDIEEVSEAIHPIVNNLDKRFASVQNNSERMASITEAQWNQSDCSLPDFKKTTTRICPKCKGPSHYKSSCPEKEE